MVTPFIIAIDGPSASGKGSIARKLAETLDFAFLDTGLIYRAVGLAMIHHGLDMEDSVVAEHCAKSLNPNVALHEMESELRAEIVSGAASQVSAYPGVRAALLEFQRGFCTNPPGGKKGAILDGRDIGTVICPNAQIKLYITADLEIRAMRRFQDTMAQNKPAQYETILEHMRERDARDMNRADAPLKPATDAIIIDNSKENFATSWTKVWDIVQARMG